MSISWKEFDADNVNPDISAYIMSKVSKTLMDNNLESDNSMKINEFAQGKIKEYEDNQSDNLNKTLLVDIFRPHEFDHIKDNDDSLNELVEFLSKHTYDWRTGSSAVQNEIIDKYSSAGSRVIKGGRESVTLDCFVNIGNKKVAIEVEASINLDNGYFTLRQAIKNKMADYGVMIVPWHEKDSGRANEAKATGRLDREYDNKEQQSLTSAIYRIGILRELDIYKEMLKA